MSDTQRFVELASSLRRERPDVTQAIAELLGKLSVASEAIQSVGQGALSQKARIADLERQLQMVNGIRYQEMRLILPEGGDVTLRWPDHMASESADMLRNVFELQMKAHAQFMQKKASVTASDVKAEPTASCTDDSADGAT